MDRLYDRQGHNVPTTDAKFGREKSNVFEDGFTA
jgi:hypothetical protein